ncbi:MAG: HD domain-containing protein, partial [Sphaerochaeta sp.]|nr:HD domain-containing protein [Sphaerochaeta sp.]
MSEVKDQLPHDSSRVSIGGCNRESYNSYFSYKTINDPIYGGIGLSELEVRLLDTRAMQRLRRIRQTGFLSYVFPSGEHSRFVHSLGVLYIMGRFCDHLYRKEKMSLKDLCILRISALLHDVGHYPYSHLTEAVYSYQQPHETVESFGVVKTGRKSLISKIANKDKVKLVDHEHFGKYIISNDPDINELLTTNGYNTKLIGDIITGECAIEEDSDGNRSTVYRQLMHSALDADRMDYLLRDSMQTGVIFGKIDFNYIINSLTIVDDNYKQDSGDDKIKVVAVEARGQHAVEHYLMSRYFHYVQTIQHKTAVAFEAITKALLCKMLSSGESFIEPY